MNASADRLFEYLRDILYAPKQAALALEELDEDHRQLGEGLQYFAQMLQQTRELAAQLAHGNLDVPLPPPENELAAPLKALHASLKHMTWQTQQVAKGDYQQRIDYLGDFSTAFNTMVVQMDQRQKELMSEAELSRQKSTALEQSLVLMQDLANLRQEWIVVLNRVTKQILFSNAAAQKALAQSGAQVLNVREWVLARMESMPEEGGPSAEEYTAEAGGRRRVFDIHSYPIRWKGMNAVAFIFADISEQYNRLHQLENEAYQDTLTQLHNRMYGIRILKEWVEQRRSFCLCFADLDNLKYVNDNFGHQKGDEYLVAAARLLSGFSPDALVARLGGDEFMLLQAHTNCREVKRRMESVRAQLHGSTNGEGYYASISYGVVEVGPDNPYTASELLAKADENMYNYKREHKNERFKLTNTKALIDE